MTSPEIINNTAFETPASSEEDVSETRENSVFGRIKSVAKWTAVAGLSAVLLVHVSAFLMAFVQPGITPNMVGTLLTGTALKKDGVALDEISPNLVYAVIAAEDSKFCQHDGFDVEAIRSAIAEKQAGGRLRGASTITQQTAKNAFFWNGGSFARKAGEAWMAFVIEQSWGKRRIMEVYLNVAEWGDGIYGAEAAAQNRFGKSASDLSSYEAALLASVLPSPNKWRVDPPGNYVAGRAGTIQQRMGVVRRDGLAGCVYPSSD
ncbi:MAG: monofunctional biosynthetic peptidoglycan transglycosylase [Ponticaulis sp.]|nr:monofunctional biosynthetic peptidoglycan transglycosylase [Ponticaulis sp.]